eukprot:CFRG7596T1
MSLQALMNVTPGTGSEQSAPDSVLFKENDRACEICYQSQGAYTCPKCLVRYCALECYRSEKHMNCYEGFYKDLVHEELSSREVSREKREEVLAMVERAQEHTPVNHNSTATFGANPYLNTRLSKNDVGDIQSELQEESEEDDELPSIMDRLSGIDLDDEESVEAIWESMTAEEKEDFEKAISDGRMGNMLTLWQPWWEMETPNMYIPKCIPEFSTLDRKTPRRLENQPEHIKMFQPSSTTTSTSNSTSTSTPTSTLTSSPRQLQFNMLDMLMALVYTIRSFNGDLSSAKALDCLLDLSGVLKNGAVHTTASHAVQTFVLNANQRLNRLEAPLWDVEATLKDTELLLSKSHVSILCGLTELHYWFITQKNTTSITASTNTNICSPENTQTSGHLFKNTSSSKICKEKSAKKEKTRVRKNKQGSKGNHAHVQNAYHNHARKIWFYLSWINDTLAGGSVHSRKCIADMVNVVRNERMRLQTIRTEVLGKGKDVERIGHIDLNIKSIPGDGKDISIYDGARSRLEKKSGYFDSRTELRANTQNSHESVDIRRTDGVVGNREHDKTQTRNIHDIDNITETTESTSDGEGLYGEVHGVVKSRTKSAFALRREQREQRLWKEERRKALPKLTEISSHLMGRK